MYVERERETVGVVNPTSTSEGPETRTLLGCASQQQPTVVTTRYTEYIYRKKKEQRISFKSMIKKNTK